MMLYLLVSTSAWFIGLMIIRWIHSQHPLEVVVSPVPPPSQPAPLVSICFPARNEENNIRRSVTAALNQDYPNFEVIVVDDRSTDATLTRLMELAGQFPRLKIISGSDLPDGWVGKPHALHQAAAAARGEWLCFVDADTFLSVEAVSSVYAMALETRADLFTMLTDQLLGSFWEKTVMPLVMTALSVGFSSRKINDPSYPDAIANGQFIFIKRSVYDAVGGHEKIKDSIVEDKALSEQVKWNGFHLVVADGMAVAATRMYTSLASMWEGWTKNIYLGLRDRPSLLLLGAFGAFLALFASVCLPVWLFLGLIWFMRGGGWMAWVVLGEVMVLWSYLVFLRAGICSRMRISSWYALTTPIGAGVFAMMMFASAWKVLSGQGVQWRGRVYRPKS